MKKIIVLISLCVPILLTQSFRDRKYGMVSPQTDSLRALYSLATGNWPKPTVDSGVVWKEFEPLPDFDTSYFATMEKPDVVLGKMLFFDPRLSGSNQISCSSCHNPQTSWADKISTSVGHDHQIGKRNSISLLNVHARKTFFWDGRATTLEEQVKNPIEAHDEMAMDATKLPKKIYKIHGYRTLFKEAYGTDKITFDRIAQALAAFQMTISSRQSRFDRFLKGEHKMLNDQEIKGLHLFRTKARCMNCHHGQYFTDEDFHNIGLTYYKRKYEDLGRYHVTDNPDDVGKFRTPSLRDVMNTAPWMHNGLFDNITGLLNIYNSGMQMNTAKPEVKAKDPMAPVTDPLMKPLKLTKQEIQDVIAFLGAITATEYKMRRPEVLPN
ncbi:MAG: c-type cytochrome [Sphingobacterium sp.]|jgi:cytochrome c peroxidase|nr:c-type cytochrome [Sphingobacterium sp.]